MKKQSVQKTPFSIISLGCARTLVDTEKVIDQLHKVGFQLTAEGSGEKVTILNTCSFIQSAIEETESNIYSLITRKENGDIKFLSVIGCYVSRFKKSDLRKKFPQVDLWLTTKEESSIQQKLSQLVFQRKFQPQPNHHYTKLTPSHYAYLKISEGCDNWCSFCTIPKIRGKHTSKPVDQIIAEAQLQIQFGAKELILIAEDTTAWGEDIYGKPSLPLLVNALSELEIDWIRLMYIFPSRVDTKLIECITQNPKVVHYLDMPIQHVNSDLLHAMNRRHNKTFLLQKMDAFFEIPDFSWRTTFILGFPTETDDHVDEIIEFIEKYPVQQLGCFPYSEEKETRSARYKNKLSDADIQNRIHRVMSRQSELVQIRHAALLNSIQSILYEGHGIGRSYREAPDVDGRYLIENADRLSPGTFIQVKVTGVEGYDLKCIAING